MSSVRDRIRAFNSGKSSDGDDRFGLNQPSPGRIFLQPASTPTSASPYPGSLKEKLTEHLPDASVASISNGKHEPILHDVKAQAARPTQPAIFCSGSSFKGRQASAADAAAGDSLYDNSNNDGCWESTAPSTPATSEVLPMAASPERMPHKWRPRSLTSKQLQQAQQKQQDELEIETQQAGQAQTLPGAPSAAAGCVSPAHACAMQPCTGGSSQQSAGPEYQPGPPGSAYGPPGHTAVRPCPLKPMPLASDVTLEARVPFTLEICV